MSEQSRQLEEIVNAVPMGVVVLDGDLRVQLVNSAARKHLAHLGDVQPGETLAQLGSQPLAELLAAGPDERVELLGGQRTFEVMVSRIDNTPRDGRWVLVIDDVTQGREVQQRAQMQDRLAAIGQLAAGIAHDFNNLLAVIVLHTQLGLLQPQLPPALRDCLDTILGQAIRAGDLVQQILDYGRRAVLERRPLPFGPFVAEQVRLLTRTLPENISVRFEEEPIEHTVDADPTRLQQVIVNLALNARDAMQEGGELHFVIDTVTVREPNEGPLPELLPGHWVRLRIADTGHGIPPHVLPRIFEPFFTTKAPLGTGLGLAQVHGIVKQHAGEITVASEPGRGTTFALYLPATQRVEPEPGPVVDDVLALGHGETVLVVEDDRAVRLALVASLEQLEYSPREARNGREALAILLQPNDVALVLSDMIMPEMGGLALLNALKVHQITTPLVFLSGHPMDHDPSVPGQDEYAGWLQKPVSLEALAGLLARLVPRR
jgi:signal transduction histidine kinase/CheY-like chemotaxis protein